MGSVQYHLRYQCAVDVCNANSSLMQVAAKVSRGTRVLDVGCACGDLGVYLHSAKQCLMRGIEYDPESVKTALATGAYESVECVDIDASSWVSNVSFDCIVFADVLEHLRFPEKTLQDALPFLSPGGNIVVSLPNIAHGSIALQLMAGKFDYMEHGILDRTHLRFFVCESMARLFAERGLAVISCTHTIRDLPGLHPYNPYSCAPVKVVNAIAANPLAFVWQYIAELVPSETPPEELTTINLKALRTLTEEELQSVKQYQDRWTSGEIRMQIRRIAWYLGNNLKKTGKRYVHPRLWAALKSCRNALRIGCRRYLNVVGNIVTACRYTEQIQRIPDKHSAEFVGIRSTPVRPSGGCPKAVAFYLPQFHPCKQNDEWWGKGFTEWTNVTKAVPLFLGHYQPHCPIDVGYYDLRVSEVMHRQVELARLYGLYGFCFHYYWFSGTRLLEKPLFAYHADKNLDFPFCLCWANEPWSRRWDGSENDLLIGQEFSKGDEYRFIADMLPFLRDERYIAVDGRPVVVIYRPHYWARAKVLTMTALMRQAVREHGLKDLYLVAALSHDFDGNPPDWGFDACVEFPPHGCGMTPYVKGLHFVNRNFTGTVFDARHLSMTSARSTPTEYTLFNTVFPAWDNTARKPDSAHIFHHTSPKLYKKWLKDALAYTCRRNSPHEQFVFINAWNEWGEGAHLEPDRKYGYAYLQATAEALEEFSSLGCGGL
ncbi:MAG: glycoside hydrolase family 99-like domain-containing protein [Desulfovibrio sp.]|nr:glycoside hydrolase family 99-like domain-containing protein [Desulfovibrio sp.]